VHVAAEVSESGAALITKVVVVWVDGGGRVRGSRVVTALGNLDVAEGERWPVASARAAIFPQPGGITTPVGNNKAHVLMHVIGHVAEV